MRGAVAADGDEAAVSLFVGFARKLDGVAGPGGGNDVNLQSLFAQTCERWPGQLGRAAATGGWVDDCKELMPQSRFIPSEEVLVADRA